MVRFGKRLIADRVEEWSGYYINYKLMKKKVKQYAQSINGSPDDRRILFKEFSRMLDDQIEKIVMFILKQQGLFATRIDKLNEQRKALPQIYNPEQADLFREGYREIGSDLLKLLRFVNLNATGIRKIMKKFDKRFGYKFTDHYVTTRSNHPYSQIQQVFKHVGIGAVIGALSRNLVELQDNPGSFLSIYDQPSIVLKDPIIESIEAAVDKVTHTTSLIQFLGQNALILQEDLRTTEVDSVTDDDRDYHFISLLLNLANTFLYMVNTYIIVPTADDYALSLGAAATVCGIIIGSMAVAQIFSSVYFSAWSNKSYLQPLVFSSITLFFGNIMYALAYDANSIALLLIGRLLCGLGSARAVNRRYISDCVPRKQRMKASAAFVSASALGMAFGPALAGFLQLDVKLYNISFNTNTMPGWVMAFSWLFYLIFLSFFFKEPPQQIEDVDFPPQGDVETGLTCTVVDEITMEEPLLGNLGRNAKEENDEDEDYDDSEEAAEDSHEPATSIVSAYRLLTPSVKVQLLIYFMLKFAMEILLSSSSVITTFYFNWSTSTVAMFLALLGLTVLPVNVMVGSYISNMFEERQILLVSEILLFCGILFSFNITSSYTVLQYVISALVTFVSAEVLEGVNLSLLSQVMSSRLSRGTYNGGLLSTEAGTLARVAADVTITAIGYLGVSKLLNVTLIPSILICTCSVVATFWTYNSLY